MLTEARRAVVGIVDYLVKPISEEALFNSELIGDSSLGVYVHVPFCPTICSFCAFSVVQDRNPDQKQNYVNAVSTQIQRVGAKLSENPIDWVYLGGGTPSVLEPEQLEQIFTSLEVFREIHPQASVTMESRVDDLRVDLVQKQEEIGINRWSVGIQTLSDKERSKYGLQLSSDEALEALGALEGKEYNVDLIFGGPDQTIEEWQETLDKIMKVRPPQLTAYMYMPLAGTHAFEKSRQNWLKWKRRQYKMTEKLLSAMSENGYKQSDTFMFSRIEDTNDKSIPYADVSMIATKTPIVGFGQSAYSLLPHAVAVNPRDIDSFIQAENDGEIKQEYLGRSNDLMMKGLRLFARMTSLLSILTANKEYKQNTNQVFLSYLIWTEIYRLARDWNTLSSRVGYYTTAISRKNELSKNSKYQEINLRQ